MLGCFLEFSVQTPKILSSLAFYKSLGFVELEIGEIWQHKYAVVSDGELCIGLHDREFDSPALTFVHHKLAPLARNMSDHGFEFSLMKTDEDVFNELGFVDRDGNMVTLLEARTFSPPGYDTNDSLCGSWFEVTLPARDAMRSGRFWAPLAPLLLRLREEPTTHMRFEAGGISLGVSESIALDRASLCFKCPDKAGVAAAIEQLQLKHEKYPGLEGAFVALEAPEGTKLYLFEEDFLGELYLVDESDDPPDR